MSAKSKSLWIVLISILSLLVVVLSTALVLVNRSASYSASVSIGYSYNGAVRADIAMSAAKYVTETRSAVQIDGADTKSFSISPEVAAPNGNFSIDYGDCTLMGVDISITNKDVFPLRVSLTYDHTISDTGTYTARIAYGTKTTSSGYPYGNYFVDIRNTKVGGNATYRLYKANSATSFTQVTSTTMTTDSLLEMCNYTTSGLVTGDNSVIIQPNQKLFIRLAVYSTDYDYAFTVNGNIAINMSVVE